MSNKVRKGAIAILAFGAVVLGAGSAWAFTTSVMSGVTAANGRVSGCYDSTGALRVVSPGSSCGTDTSITWVGKNQTAVVFSNGTLLGGVGVSKVTHPTTGLYDVYFSYSQAGKCTQIASLADMSAGTITAYGGQVASNVVQVQTTDAAGASADRTFQLLLSC